MSRADARDHDNPNAIRLREERVPEHHRQLGRSKRNMHAWDASILRIEGADAFLKSEERLIDLSSFQSSLPVITLCVLGSL